MALYARTLAPGLTWAHNGSDGGDLLAAALTHGVPHPSGYPTYQLLLRAAIAAFPGEPARAGNWLSAICAAAAVALAAGLSQRMLVTWSRNAPTTISLVAAAAALTWGASPALWGQAVITEVYALNALAAIALLALLWRWREAADEGLPGWPWLAGAGLILGLGLGNHLSLALMLPAAAAWLWSGRRAAGASLHRSLSAAAAAAALGLLVYAYLPWAATTNSPINWEDPRTPAAFWRLVSGQVYRGLVFGVPVAYLPGRLAAWASEFLRQFGGPWGALLALIGLWRIDRRAHGWWRATGLIALAYSLYAVTYNTPDSFVYLIPAWCMAALWLAAGLDWLATEVATTSGAIFRAVSHAAGGATPDEKLTPRRKERREQSDSASHLGAFASLRETGAGIFRAVSHAGRGATAPAGENAPSRSVIGEPAASDGRVTDPPGAMLRAGALAVALVVVLAAVPAVSVIRFWRENDLSREQAARRFVDDALADAAPAAVILAAGDEATFALWYGVYGLGERPDVAPVNINLYAFDWYRRSLAGRHPNLAAALGEPGEPRFDDFLAAVAATRPLYRSDELDTIPPGFVEEPAGSLVKLSRQADK